MSSPTRTLAVLVTVALLSGAALAGSATAAPARRRPEPGHRPEVGSAAQRSAAAPVLVGGLMLRPCDVVANALCGSVERPWEPGNPGAGTVTVGFAFVPASSSRAVLGTVVPHEGGPGYSTTGTGGSYAQMYGPLLRRRNLLLVDQRGTGLSEPVGCPALQNLTIAYNVAAGRCGRALGPRADDYTTARSADDLAAVVHRLRLGPVDLFRRLLRHVLLTGVRRAAPDVAAQPGARQRLPDVRRVGLVPHPGAGDAPCLRPRLPSVSSLSEGRRSLPADSAAGSRFRPRAPLAWCRLRRRRSSGHGVCERSEPDVGRLRRDVLAGVLPGDDRRAAVGTARRPRADPAAGRRGHRGWHRRRGPGRLQRGPGRRGHVSRLPAALRHDVPARGHTREALRRRARPAQPTPSAHLRAFHGPRVRPLGLAVARLVHPLADRTGGQPRRDSHSARRSLPAAAGARAQR